MRGFKLLGMALALGMFSGAALADATVPPSVTMLPITVGTTTIPAGPVVIGQPLPTQCDMEHPCSAPSAAPVVVARAAPSGGLIQLSAFGWLEPYVDSVVQALILAGLSWLAKSKYTQWMDQSARDALATFTKNTASSLIADGFVRMQGKSVTVSSAA